MDEYDDECDEKTMLTECSESIMRRVHIDVGKI